MKIVNCKVNHIENPLGFRLDTPVFSFITEEAEGKKQEAARILVTLDPEGKQVAADTGMCSGVDSLGTALKMELAPRTRYYWRAAVRSELGEEAVSGLNWFETGKMDEAWQGRWISCKKEEGRHRMRKRIYVRLQGRLLIHVDHSIQTLQTHESFDNENRDTGGSCNYRQRAFVKSKYNSDNKSCGCTYYAGC